MGKGFDETTTLGVHWSKREKDWTITYPNRPDAHLIHNDLLRTEVFNELVKELEGRGYDTETLRFSIKKKKGNDGC